MAEIGLVSSVKTKRNEPAPPKGLYTSDYFNEIRSYAEWSDLDASHKRAEVETDLIGAYYLEVGEAPLAQFGYTENLSP